MATLELRFFELAMYSISCCHDNSEVCCKLTPTFSLLELSILLPNRQREADGQDEAFDVLRVGSGLVVHISRLRRAADQVAASLPSRKSQEKQYYHPKREKRIDLLEKRTLQAINEIGIEGN